MSTAAPLPPAPLPHPATPAPPTPHCAHRTPSPRRRQHPTTPTRIVTAVADTTHHATSRPDPSTKRLGHHTRTPSAARSPPRTHTHARTHARGPVANLRLRDRVDPCAIAGACFGSKTSGHAAFARRVWRPTSKPTQRQERTSRAMDPRSTALATRRHTRWPIGSTSGRINRHREVCEQRHTPLPARRTPPKRARTSRARPHTSGHTRTPSSTGHA